MISVSASEDLRSKVDEQEYALMDKEDVYSVEELLIVEHFPVFKKQSYAIGNSKRIKLLEKKNVANSNFNKWLKRINIDSLTEFIKELEKTVNNEEQEDVEVDDEVESVNTEDGEVTVEETITEALEEDFNETIKQPPAQQRIFTIEYIPRDRRELFDLGSTKRYTSLTIADINERVGKYFDK